MSDNVRVPLRRFDVRALKPDRIVLLVGKRGTGKSTLLNDLLSYLYKEYDDGCGMSPTPESQEMFANYMPTSCIYPEFDGEKIKELVDMVRKLNQNGIYRRLFVLLDDCMFDKKVMAGTPMREIHMNLSRTPQHTPPRPPRITLVWRSFLSLSISLLFFS